MFESDEIQSASAHIKCCTYYFIEQLEIRNKAGKDELE